MFGTAWTLSIALAFQSAGAAAPAPQTPAPPVVWTDDRPLVRLVPNLVRDIRSLPSGDTALWLAVGGAAALVARESDTRLATWTAGAGTPAYAQAGSALGNGWTQVGGAVAAYAVGRIAKRPQLTHVGGDLIRSQALNAVVNTSLKVAVDRTRPSGGRYAFPSGHTSSAFASAAVLHAHYGWKAGAPAFGVASFVGWARVREHKHWLSDVAFGAAVGIVSGRTVAKTHRSKVTVVATPTKGGVSLMLFVNQQPAR